MGIGDVTSVETGGCTDLYHVDTGMYDTDAYGAVYILDAERPAIVETGIGTHHERILDALADVGLAPEAIDVIALTHLHLDHAGGAGVLAAACPNANVAVHEIGVSHLANPSQLVSGTKQAVEDLWEFYTEPKPVPEGRLRGVTDGETIDLGDHQLDVYHAPGHAPHQVIYHDPANWAVFTGDAAGVWIPSQNRVKETTPPRGFDLEASLDDLETICDLDPETLLYTHFGPHSTPKSVLRDYEAVLTEWVNAVETKRDELRRDSAVVDHFVSETEMSDVWGERMALPVTSVDVRGVLRYLDETADEDQKNG